MGGTDQEIYNFLNSEDLDYFYGVSLLRSVCSKRGLMNTLSKGKSPKRLELLLYELKKNINYAKIQEEEGNTSEENAELRKRAIQSKSVHADNGQPEQEGFVSESIVIDHKRGFGGRASTDLANLKVRQLIQNRNGKYALRDHYHGQLHSATSDDERFDLAKEILKRGTEIDDYNFRIDQVYETGQIDHKSAIELLSAEEYKTLQNVKIYISRYKRKVSSAKSLKSRENAQKTLDKYQSERDKLLQR